MTSTVDARILIAIVIEKENESDFELGNFLRICVVDSHVCVRFCMGSPAVGVFSWLHKVSWQCMPSYRSKLPSHELHLESKDPRSLWVFSLSTLVILVSYRQAVVCVHYIASQIGPVEDCVVWSFCQLRAFV